MIKTYQSKLVLGTAQFGQAYGITNLTGKIKKVDAYRILDRALQSNINAIDTAISYGDSHKVLSNFPQLNEFLIITKLPELDTPINNNQLRKRIISLANDFDRPRIDYLLLHRPNQLFQKHGDKIWRCLKTLKEESIISKIGCSVYEPEEALKLMDNFKMDIIQCPFSIFDRRFHTYGILDLASQNKVEIHARSIFLQGLLLLSSSQIPTKFSKWRHCWEKFERWLYEKKINRMEGLINFPLQDKRISKVIFGVTSINDLEEILNNINPQILINNLPIFSDDEELIDPRRWQ